VHGPSSSGIQVIRMRKRLSLLCICLMLSSILVVAFHHHEDGDDHDDCPICHAGMQHSPVELPVPIHAIQTDFVKFEFFIPTFCSIIKNFSSQANTRAPPA